MMSLAISQNPHTKNPKELANSLKNAYRQFTNASDILNPNTDKDAVSKLKSILGGKGK
jgi:predicted metalloendopeptidase